MIMRSTQIITASGKWLIYALLFVSLVMAMIACESLEEAVETVKQETKEQVVETVKQETKEQAVEAVETVKQETKEQAVETVKQETFKNSVGKGPRLMSGGDALKETLKITEPFGAESVKIFAKIKSNSFEDNIKISNQWIQDQISFYDRSDDKYQLYLHEMMNGSGDGGLGMTKWLTDKDNVAYWDKAVRRNVGEEGYSRIVALNEAFEIGTDSFRLGYGGVHRFDRKTNQVTLNGVTSFPGVEGLVRVNSSQSTGENFDVLVKYGDKVRQRMFNFYDAWYAGKLDREQVSKFNDAYVRAGACGIAATDVVSDDVGYRYAQSLSLMSTTLRDLGF